MQPTHLPHTRSRKFHCPILVRLRFGIHSTAQIIQYPIFVLEIDPRHIIVFILRPPLAFRCLPRPVVCLVVEQPEGVLRFALHLQRPVVGHIAGGRLHGIRVVLGYNIGEAREGAVRVDPSEDVLCRRERELEDDRGGRLEAEERAARLCTPDAYPRARRGSEIDTAS